MTSIATTIWIGPDENLAVGDIGFLISHSPEGRTGRYYLRDTPAHTNQSNEPRLHGWCGSYNNISTSACGLVRVERMARNARALVRQLDGDALQAALDDLGYPELMPAPVTTRE